MGRGRELAELQALQRRVWGEVTYARDLAARRRAMQQRRGFVAAVVAFGLAVGCVWPDAQASYHERAVPIVRRARRARPHATPNHVTRNPPTAVTVPGRPPVTVRELAQLSPPTTASPPHPFVTPQPRVPLRATPPRVVAAAPPPDDFTVLSPARWRCGAHPYLVNPNDAPPNGVALVQAAFTQLNAASGGRVQWTYAGTTTATGARAGKVIVFWSRTSPVLPPTDSGVGAPQPWPNAREWTGGVIVLNLRYPLDLGVILHEAGHIAGLGHARSSAETMYPNPSGKRSYSADDVAGLRMVAAQCKP